MIMRKIIPLIFSVSYALISYASEETKKPQADKITGQPVTERLITGILFRYPWFVHRTSDPHYRLPAPYSSKEVLPQEDTWLDAWATSKESTNWGSHGHPNLPDKFPQILPLTLFLKEDKTLKTDGDTVELFHTHTQTKAVTRILLTLKQKHLGSEYGAFDEVLKSSPDYVKKIKPYITEKTSLK